jgi:murein L,D-transpeptidase YcbB/YkuD
MIGRLTLALALATAAGGSLRAEQRAAPSAAASPIIKEDAGVKLGAEPLPMKEDADDPAAEKEPIPEADEPPLSVTLEPVAKPVELNPPSGTAAEAARTEQPAAISETTAAPKPAEASATTRLDIPDPTTPAQEALRKAVSALPAGGSDEERNERAALVSFYEIRHYAPLWLDAQGKLSAKGGEAMAEIKSAKDWGLDPRDFALPSTEPAAASPEAIAASELKFSLAVLKYGRYARGGRIIDPSEQLSSYLDRRPQLLKPAAILYGAEGAEHADLFLRSLHPAHPQFERLRQKYLALHERGRQQSSEAKRLLANMEEWRWMPADLGDVYVWNNIPEFIQRVVKRDGEILRKERIVAGKTDKQTPIFSRPLRKIVFKPTWIVPDSIKVRELWPNLMRGGGLMRQWGLEVTSKEGQPINWRKIDWTTADIRTYEVIQPNGSKSVLGKVKFSFPSQHTVFMHDTVEKDKWMFDVSRRTYSHGCMRVANPVGLAEVVLQEDKGWSPAETRRTLNTGPNNNEIAIEHKIPVHITYFTALVDDDGKLHTFPDVYGHQRRIELALDGKWGQIVKGSDHLAPVELDMAAAMRPSRHAEDQANDLPPPVWRQEPPPAPTFRSSFFDTLFRRSGGY